MFDLGRPQNEQPGGRVFAIWQRGARVTGVVEHGEVELSFHESADWLKELAPGQSVWKSDDPHLTRRLRQSYARGRIGRRMPLTMGAFTVAAFMLAGLPPGPAFVSKWRLLTGAVESGAWAAAGALLASTLLNIAYFTPIVVRAFGPALSGPGHAGGHGEAPLTVLVPLLLTAAAGLVLGLAPDAGGHFLALARAVAESVSR